MSKKNYLNSAEMYRLTKCVESAKGPFESWRHAIRVFAAEMNREVTRANIETAAGNCGIDVSDLVRVDRNSHPFTNMMAQLNELRTRVEELERLIHE